MPYIVFARKWRPKTFDEIVGQEHITTTLKNAISRDRVAHAYLFTGSRGIGKTTTARILAKALNCQHGPTITPCNECPSCKEISAGISLDTIEVDGASNRGIDEIRTLRENVKFSPAKGKFKIYIIDEVHMLTAEAFNALLKTLEEPPAHVKFIFATTQPRKVLATILSRCQRFDFKKLSTAAIVTKLKKIVAAESLDVAEETLFYIARAADGSMRDAESILDQLGSFCEGKIEPDQVVSILGMVDQDMLFAATEAIINKDSVAALNIVERIINQGKDPAQFAGSLIEHFRNIMIARLDTKDKRGDLADLIELSREHIERISRQAAQFSHEDILYILNLLFNTQEAMKIAISTRVALELAMVKLTRREGIVALPDILKSLTELEKRVNGGKKIIAAPESAPIEEVIEEEEVFEPEPVRTPINTASSDNGLSLSKIKEIWPHLLKKIQSEKMPLAAFLMEGEPIKIEEKIITIAFAKEQGFHKESLERAENKKLVEWAFSEILKDDIKVDFGLIERAPRDKTKPMAGKGPKIDPAIQAALNTFGGEIIPSTSGFSADSGRKGY